MPVPEHIPSEARSTAVEIVRVLRDAGHVAYFAGGCVRDELLGRVPSDYDVATDAPPRRIVSLFPKTNEVGAAFGVVLVRLEKSVVEVATFRSDGEYSDRRRPDSVTFSDAPSDASRRDFTVNALFLDPLCDQTSAAGERASPLGGRVIDFVGGLVDLDRKVLRAVGDPHQRLKEDHLRALRAARLAAKLGFHIDAATAEAIRLHAKDLAGVSRERIGEEMRRVLSHPSRAAGLELLTELGLEPVVLGDGEMPAPSPTTGMKCVTALSPGASIEQVLAAWALDRGHESSSALVARWRRGLCLSNDERDGMLHILDMVATIEQKWLGSRVADQKRAAADNRFNQALNLVMVRNPALASEVQARVLALRDTPQGLNPEPFITGDDLIAMGMKPGPKFKGILVELYNAQLENSVKTRAEAIAFVNQLRSTD